MAMTDPILHALQAHTKEPEEVDWEARYFRLSKNHDHSCDCYEQEIARLKDTILRLEQKCATLEECR